MSFVLQSATEDIIMNKSNKTISISIRVSEEELERLKRASRIEEYSSYSEFIRRTSLLEANKIINNNINDSIDDGSNQNG